MHHQQFDSQGMFAEKEEIQASTDRPSQAIHRSQSPQTAQECNSHSKCISCVVLTSSGQIFPNLHRRSSLYLPGMLVLNNIVSLLAVWNTAVCMVAGFHHSVIEVCALLGFFAAQNSNFILMFWDNMWVPS